MKFLLAVDASPASESALEGIVARPWPAASSFEVVSVVEPSPLWTTSEAAMESVQAARELVRIAVAKLQAKGLQASGSALSGDPRLQIIDRARESEVDFVFVGSHGHSAVSRFLLGNVASTVLRHAPCSVGVIRAESSEEDTGQDMGQDTGQGMKVLLATDGSEFSDLAAQSIAARPWPAGSEVRVISAVQLMLPAMNALFDLPFVETKVVEDARADAMKRALAAIAGAKNALSGAGVTVSDSVSVLFEHPREIVLQEAAAWGADLIVLGSHGRHGPDRFLLGGVSEAVAMHAACSVEVIRGRPYSFGA